MLDWLIQDGRVALLALAVLFAELVIVCCIPRLRSLSFVANSVSGLALMAALYAALTASRPSMVVLALLAALVGHLIYLVPTLRR